LEGACAVNLNALNFTAVTTVSDMNVYKPLQFEEKNKPTKCTN